jgi:K+/H+ antiporter YhaU regulatory subunit KhtT
LIGVVSLLCVVTLGFLITRVAAVALRATGMSADAARFQARSAFSGVGFTTLESEDILTHPGRRKIVLALMALSGAGVATTFASLLLSFVGTSGYRQPAGRLAILVIGLSLIGWVASSRWVDRHLSRLIERVLARTTDLDARDYVRLLDIQGDHSIDEITVEPGEWLEGRLICDLQLANEGVVVLGIRRPNGRYTGAPTGMTPIRLGDTVVVYGRTSALNELRNRRAGVAGDRAHADAKAEYERIVAQEAIDDRRTAAPQRQEHLQGG